MDLTAFSITLVMNALMLLLPAFVHNGLSHKPERTFPRIVPSKLQFFEHGSLTVNCEGFFTNMTKWRVMRRISAGNTTKLTTTPCNKDSKKLGACHITVLYTADSGEYWCETDNNKERSERVRITVTAGDVILESPVHPVTVGDSVTLHCIEKTKHKKASTKFSFYKDRVLLKTSSTGEMTIYNVSVSDQGQYRCNISENKFSEENLLRVRAVLLECPDRPVMKDEDVTLFCRDKMAAPNYTSYFYKDGNLIQNSSTGNLTLYRVSKMDKGVYKCKTSEDRESEEEWLAVRGVLQTSVLPLTALVALPLPLLVLGLIYKKYKGKSSRAPDSSPLRPDCRVTGGTETYDFVTKPKSNTRAAVFEETAVYSEINDCDVEADNFNGCALANKTDGEMYSKINKLHKTKGCGPSKRVEGELYSTVNKKNKTKTRADQWG